jgi:hypothetical protein
MSDNVNSPSHYNQSNIECIDAIRAALGEEGFVAYCRGNAIKYNWRAGHKVSTTGSTDSGKEDLQKAAWYSKMASGDDPRYRASAPNLSAERCDHPTVAPLHADTADQTGLVPPECDDRPTTCWHDLHFDATGSFATCRKCGTQPGIKDG